WHGVGRLSSAQELPPFGLPCARFGDPRSMSGDGLRGVLACDIQKLAQHERGVAYDAHGWWKIPPDLLWVDIDVDKFGGWKAVGHAGQPGAGRTVVEARAERQDDIGASRRLVCRVRAVAAGGAQPERAVLVNYALAEWRCDHRDL